MITEKFIDKQSRTITINLDEDGGHAEAWSGETLIGHMDWDLREVALDDQGESIEGALLIHIYLDNIPGYTNCGIGTKIVEMIRECTGVDVFVRPDKGAKYDDGSHPTQDAPGFFKSLTKKKLAFWFE